MNVTITDTKPGRQIDRYSSKYAAVYSEVDRALKDGREIELSNFDNFNMALNVDKGVRRYYGRVAYIDFSKYGHNGVIAPRIKISPRNEAK